MSIEQGAPPEAVIVAAIAAACGRDAAQLHLDLVLSDLGIDSFGMAILIANLQRACDCELGQQQILRLFQALRVSDVIVVMREAGTRT